MNKGDEANLPYCIYPPAISDGVGVTKLVDDNTVRYILKNNHTSRYFQLKTPEFLIFQQINGCQDLADIAKGGEENTSPKVTLKSLIKFLSKLDSLNLLARGGFQIPTSVQTQKDLYPTFHLINPDKFLQWLNNKVDWLFTKQFLIATLLFNALVFSGIILRVDEFTSYISYTYSTYGLVTILLFTLTITATHEFAHGLACKHFGGEVKTMGVLMVYFVIPAFYCNVTDIYRFGDKKKRLWVIGAGIYWQLIVSSFAAFIWLLATPYTVLADFSFLAVLGGTFNILVNCNPLIKLDGYYALSQYLGVTNLQSQSTRYVRALFSNLLFNGEAETLPQKHGVLYVFYWLGSILYSTLLIYTLTNWAGAWFMDNFGFIGVLLTLALVVLLAKKFWIPITKRLRQSCSALRKRAFVGVFIMSKNENKPSRIDSTPNEDEKSTRKISSKRKMLFKTAFVILALAALITPWEASSSSDCTLQLPTGFEEVTRANTNAVLAEAFVQPGDAVIEGTKIARLSNPELEDRLTQINAEIQRLDSNASRLEDEIQVRSEAMLSASFKETERKRILSEFKNESSQIKAAFERTMSPLPATLAILKSEIELKETELEHNAREVERYKKLFEQQLIGTQVYDRAVAAMKISEKELQTAKAKLEAAIVEHRRLTSSTETTSLIAETESRAARSNFEALLAELSANRQQLESLKRRQEILKREYDGMVVTAPRSGVILGEDLRKQLGSHFNQGQEICRVGELEKFLLKIEVSEREISSVRLENPVRFKLKTIPGKTFTGRVAKINAEPNTNQNGQRFYPVEVFIDNADGLLRPGMTGFARISFGRQAVGVILVEKVWQALRPELWLF
jgi:multidrug efflux pump subunit AcrA (membrane-fusion protein)